MTRTIRNLQWAKALPAKPRGIPQSRPRGRKAAGLRYEKAFAKTLPDAIHGQWFEFEDAKGYGVCQTDLLLHGKNTVLILENKYTWTPDAYQQLYGLYFPVVQAAFGKEVLGVQVCKVLVPGLPKRVQVESTLEEAVRAAREGKDAVLHWIGVGTV
jgi:hypothetical protein